jgi:hypothetical protein
VQVTQLLWNLFDLAPESADTAGASIGGSSSVVQQQTHTDGQQQQQSSESVSSQREASIQQLPQQQEQPARDAVSKGSHVAHELVHALTMALQQQVATCSSLQVRVC